MTLIKGDFIQSIDKAALAKALAVHLVIIMMFIFSWQSHSTDITPPPKAIKVQLKPKPKQLKTKQTTKKKTVKKPVKKKPVKKKPKPKKEQPKKPVKPKKPPKESPKEKPKEPVKKKEKPKEVKKEPVETIDFDKLLADEKSKIKENKPLPKAPVEDEIDEDLLSEIDKYMLLISQRISNHWIIPQNSRNGMRAVFTIELFPGGELKSIRLKEGSGHSGFDGAARSAVIAAGRFEVPSDPILFNREFKQFDYIFRPTNLRN